MDTRTMHDVSKELEAHERECAVYRSSTQRSLDSLESRIKRLELMIMTSTISIVGAVIVLISKGL